MSERRIGPYEIVGELGRGGMGVVYRGRDPALGREVAIKVMLDLTSDDEARERFVREVRLLARVSEHPGIVRIHHAGALPDGRLYYVMELVAGRSLQGAIEEGGPLAPAAAAECVAAAAEAVQHAHEQGVVHRDLAPKNIIVDDRGVPRILDFGLARPLTAATRLTATGTILGTPAYMAPEQVDGGDAVTPKTDVYGLGACLYACLTGRPPFIERTPVLTISHVLHHEPVAVERLNPAVATPLAGIVRRAMAKEPGDRHPTARALGEDLRAFIAGRPPSAPPPRRSPARRFAAAAASLLSLALLGVLGWSLWPADPSPPPAQPAAVPVPAPAPPALPDPEPAEVGVAGAIRCLADPGEVGLPTSLAFRALLPQDGDPADPFVLWEAMERAALHAIWSDVERPAPDAARPLPAAAAALDDAVATSDDAWPAWAAALAALGMDERVLLRPPPTDAARLVLARLRLVRGEPEPAIALLAPVEAASLLYPEARFLRGIAYVLLPHLERARTDFIDASVGPLRPQAARFLALIARLMPGESPVERQAAALRFQSEDDLGYRGGEERYREAALHIIEGSRPAPRGPLPQDLVVLHARMLLDADHFDEALAELSDALGRDPGSESLADAYLDALHLVGRGAADSDGLLVRYEGAVHLARRASDTAAARDAERLAGSLARHGDLTPGGLACRADWAALSAAERCGLLERARGIDALAFGLAGRLFDRALRLLVAPGRDALAPDLRGSAVLLGRLAHALAPGTFPALLLAGLRLNARPDVFGVGLPTGWRADERYPPEPLESASLRAGLSVPLLLVLAEGLVRKARAAEDPGVRRRDSRRALIFIDAARDAVGDRPAPELHLLRARCLAEARRQGVADLPDPAVAARQALDDLDRFPFLGRGVLPFLAEAAEVFEAAGLAGEAAEARRRREAWEQVDTGALRRELLRAWDSRDERSMTLLTDRAIPLVPRDYSGYFWDLGAQYAREGRPVLGLSLWGRSLRVGDWEVLQQAFSIFRQFGRFLDPPAAVSTSSAIPDEALATAVALIVDPGAPTEQIVRGIGLVTELAALGVAPGPLLAVRAYARLRLGDARGALLDARAAERAPYPHDAADAARDGRAGRAERLPALVEIVALALLDADARTLRTVIAAPPFEGDPDWISHQFGYEYAPFIERNLVRFAFSHDVLRGLLLPDVVEDQRGRSR